MTLPLSTRILLALATAGAAGCDAPSPTASPASTASSPVSSEAASVAASAASSSPPSPASQDTAAADQWLGRWTGPEGTYLLLEGGQGRYTVTVANLDGPRQFEGVAKGDGIQFTRDGATLLLHATNGADTGMKWLAGKSNCLTVQTGEGYCRD